jgi:hypothetical protein
MAYEAYVKLVSGRRFRPVLDLDAERARSVQSWVLWEKCLRGLGGAGRQDLDRGVHVVYSRERELCRCALMAGLYDRGGVHVVRRRFKGTGSAPRLPCCIPRSCAFPKSPLYSGFRVFRVFRAPPPPPTPPRARPAAYSVKKSSPRCAGKAPNPQRLSKLRGFDIDLNIDLVSTWCTGPPPVRPPGVLMRPCCLPLSQRCFRS